MHAAFIFAIVLSLQLVAARNSLAKTPPMGCVAPFLFKAAFLQCCSQAHRLTPLVAVPCARAHTPTKIFSPLHPCLLLLLQLDELGNFSM